MAAHSGWFIGLTGMTLIAGALGLGAVLSDWWAAYYYYSKMLRRTNHFNLGILIEGRLTDLLNRDFGDKAVDFDKLTGGRWTPMNRKVLREAAATFCALSGVSFFFSLFISCQKSSRQSHPLAHIILIGLLGATWLCSAIVTFHFLYINSPLLWRGERLRQKASEWYKLQWSFYLSVASFLVYFLTLAYELFVFYRIKTARPVPRSQYYIPATQASVQTTRVRCESETREMRDMRAIEPKGGAATNNDTGSSPRLGFNVLRQESVTTEQVTTVFNHYGGQPQMRHWE